MLNAVFIAITVIALLLFYVGTGKDKRILLISLLWLIIAGTLAYTGFFENNLAKPPRFLLVLLMAISLSIYFYKIISPHKLKPEYLTAIHILRLPVELCLYQLFLLKQVPLLMTFKGWNYDILMGISAIVMVMYMLYSKRKLPALFFTVWNIAGLLFLTFIVAIAILSAPLPVQQFAFEQPNVAVAKFPFAYLPAYIVPVVFLSHLLLLRKTAKAANRY
jgi:hypothetical protein